MRGLRVDTLRVEGRTQEVLDFEKLAGLAAQCWANLKDAISRVHLRLSRIAEIQGAGGILGSTFEVLYIYPQKSYRAALALAAVAGIFAFIGGLFTIFHSDSLMTLQHLFQNYGSYIVVVGFLLWLIAATDGFSRVIVELGKRIPTSFRPEAIDSPDWFNLAQFSDIFEEPRPIVLSAQGMDAVADMAVERLISGQYKADSFAEKPSGLSDAERANIAFFGCLLEWEHSVRKWNYRKWGVLYAALSQARIEGVSIFSPDFVRRIRESSGDYYGTIRASVNPLLIDAGEKPIDDSPIVSQDIQAATGSYHGRRGPSALRVPA